MENNNNIFLKEKQLRQGADNKFAIKKAFIEYCRAKGYRTMKGKTHVTKNSVTAIVLEDNVEAKHFSDVKRIYSFEFKVRLLAKDFFDKEITNNLFVID